MQLKPEQKLQDQNLSINMPYKVLSNEKGFNHTFAQTVNFEDKTGEHWINVCF